MAKKPKKSSKKSSKKKRIPAIKGAKTRTRSGDRVEVVLPTRTKIVTRDKPSTKKELKALREQVESLKSTRRAAPIRANVPTPDMSRFGGYTNLTGGFGIPEKSSKESVDDRLKQMEDRLRNEIRTQNDSVRRNERDRETDIPRTDNRRDLLRSRTRGTPTRKITPQPPPEEELPSSSSFDPFVLRESQEKARRNRQRNRNYRSGIITEEQKRRDIQIQEDKKKEREQKRIQQQVQDRIVKDKRQQLIQEGRREEITNISRDIISDAVDTSIKQSDKKRQEATESSTNIINDIVEGSLKQSDLRVSERMRRKKEEGDEVRKPEINLKDVSRTARIPIPSKVKLDVQELVDMGDTKITGSQVEQSIKPPTPQPTEDFSTDESDFEVDGDDLKDNERIQQIQETQGDIEDTARQLIEVLDEEDTQENFEDVSETEPRPRPLPNPPPQVERPLPETPPPRPLPETPPPRPQKIPLNKSTQTNNPTSSRSTNTQLDPQSFVEISRLRQMSEREPDPMPEPQPEPTPQFTKKDASDIVTGAIDRAFETATSKANEIEQKEKEDRRKKRMEIERRQRLLRGSERLQRDRQRRNRMRQSVEDVESIVGGLVDRSILTSESESAGLPRKQGQGRQPANQEAQIRKFVKNYPNEEIPDKFRDILGRKDDAERRKKELIEKIYKMGFNGRLFPFNIRDFVKITNRDKDRILLRELEQKIAQSNMSDIRGVSPEVLSDVKEIIKLKEIIKKLQNDITSIQKRGRVFSGME